MVGTYPTFHSSQNKFFASVLRRFLEIVLNASPFFFVMIIKNLTVYYEQGEIRRRSFSVDVGNHNKYFRNLVLAAVSPKMKTFVYPPVHSTPDCPHYFHLNKLMQCRDGKGCACESCPRDNYRYQK